MPASPKKNRYRNNNISNLWYSEINRNLRQPCQAEAPVGPAKVAKTAKETPASDFASRPAPGTKDEGLQGDVWKGGCASPASARLAQRSLFTRSPSDNHPEGQIHSGRPLWRRSARSSHAVSLNKPY